MTGWSPRGHHLIGSYGLLAMAVVLFAVFSAVLPDTFPTRDNVSSILSNQSIPALTGLDLNDLSAPASWAAAPLPYPAEPTASAADVAGWASTWLAAKVDAEEVWPSDLAWTVLSLAANGKRTTSKSIKVTEYISNPTKRNQQFVFYKGYTKASGRFVKYVCRIYYLPGQNYGPAFVPTTSGTWRSFAVPGEGAIRCGAGTTNLGALARAALRIGCAA